MVIGNEIASVYLLDRRAIRSAPVTTVETMTTGARRRQRPRRFAAGRRPAPSVCGPTKNRGPSADRRSYRRESRTKRRGGLRDVRKWARRVPPVVGAPRRRPRPRALYRVFIWRRLRGIYTGDRPGNRREWCVQWWHAEHRSLSEV